MLNGIGEGGAGTVVVISDLHLGGRPACGQFPCTCLNHAVNELCDFVDWLRQRVIHGESIDLIINGDFVDFLIDDTPVHESYKPNAWMRDDAEALRKLQRIVECVRRQDATGTSESFFDVLASFVAVGPKAVLIILLGNHDVELALPSVRKALLDLLGAKHGRVKIVYDGEAWTRGELLVEHGNRYDRWNMVDHCALRRERSQRSRGLVMPESPGLRYFSPPPGTLLVVYLFNRIQRELSFINRLLPEMEASLPLVLTLYPTTALIINYILYYAPARMLLGELLSEVEPSHNGHLSADYEKEIHSVEDLLFDQFGPDYINLFPDLPENPLGNLGAASWIDKVQSLMDGLVGLRDQLKSLVSTRNRVLSKLQSDLSFHLDQAPESDSYLMAAKYLIEHTRFSTIIMGHTHLPKHIPITSTNGKSGCYINTGTWIDVVHVPVASAVGQSVTEDQWDNFMDAMLNNCLEKYTKSFLGYAEVRLNSEGRVLEAGLFAYEGKDHERVQKGNRW